MPKEKLLNEARRNLLEHPYDNLHSVRHHRQVWDNCQKIVKKESLEIDMEFLEIAAWWHDVERNNEKCQLLRDTMAKLNYKAEEIEKVVGIINGHSFGRSQNSLEAKVLYDADKLEYPSTERLNELLSGRRNDSITKKRFDYYLTAWNERIDKVRGKLNFGSSNEEFEEKMVEFTKYAKQFPELPEKMKVMI